MFHRSLNLPPSSILFWSFAFTSFLNFGSASAQSSTGDFKVSNTSIQMGAGGIHPLTVDVMIPEGRHIYVQKPEDSGIIITSFSLEKSPGFAVRTETAPAGVDFEGLKILKGKGRSVSAGIYKVNLYETAGINAGQSRNITLAIRTQMCDTQKNTCFKPETLRYNISVLINQGKQVRTNTARSASGVKWVQQYSQALSRASQTDQNILVVLTAPTWCGYCMALEREVFEKDRVQKVLNSQIVPLQVTDSNPDTSKFSFDGYPTMYIYDKGGKSIKEIGGNSEKSFLNSIQPYLKSSTSVTQTQPDEPAQTNPSQGPYLGKIAQIPGQIEAENFDFGGEGISYHDLSSGNLNSNFRSSEDVDIEPASEGGYNLGDIQTGEWVLYTVDVKQSGIYRIESRVSTEVPDTSFHIELNGQDISGQISVPNTGGWQNWQTVSVESQELASGSGKLKLVMDRASYFNLNWIRFTFLRAATQTTPAQIFPEDFQELKRLAESGDGGAQAELGRRYEWGIGVGKNVNLALAWDEKSAAQGNSEGQFRMGHVYNFGFGVPRNYDTAAAWYVKSAAQNNANAQQCLAWFYWQGLSVGKDPAKAFSYARKSAEQGNKIGQHYLAMMYEEGSGTSADITQAIRWYEKSANQGHVDAQTNLGVMYFRGNGVTRDYSKAFTWWQKAANNGQPESQLNLAVLYANGWGTAKDDAKAAHWTERSARQGRSTAMEQIGIAYYKGYGVAVNKVTAYQWFGAAVKTGLSRVASRVQESEPSLSQDELARAKKWIADFKPVMEEPGTSRGLPAMIESEKKERGMGMPGPFDERK